MKVPKCKLCGKTHWSTQRCGALQPTGGSPSSEGATGPEKAIGGSHPESAAERIDGCPQTPLTPAEKQKAYIKRLKADPERHKLYLEANKLRMRKRRNGNR